MSRRCLLFPLLLLTPVPLAGQAPAAPPNRIPGPGIPVPAADRAEIEAGLRALTAALEPVRSHELAPDVAIYEKAVDWALRYDEFFTPQEIAAAKQILTQGLERASALKDGKAPWDSATGLIVRGYRSRIDDSIQPYGLVVPASYRPGDGKKHRLDLWLHGRDNNLTELKFIAERQRSPGEFTPPDAFVLHLYGRFCNASKFAGETDLFEALDHARKRYPIDEDRLVVRGFSMGGAATWHFAVHHAGLWAAAAPGAGFVETPVYARMLDDPVRPTEYEQKLWHLYNAMDYAVNLFNCPVVAYSGELDKQKAAADAMAKAMADEGLELVHVIGPGTEHRYEPEAKKEIARRIDEIAARGRDPYPAKVRFTTWTLRYDRMKWLVVDGLERHWEHARMEAELGRQEFSVSTRNVSAFSLEFPRSKAPGVVKAVIDGQALDLRSPPPGPYWRAYFRKTGGAWSQIDGEDVGLRKRHGLQGPIDDAFMERFVMVMPTGTPFSEKLGAWVAEEEKEAIEHWRRILRGDARVVADTALTDAEIAASHLLLWGDPSSNRVLARIADKLPIRWTAAGVQVGERTFDASRYVPAFIYPNPLNPKRYVVVNSGFTWKEQSAASNARHVPLLPDWAVLDTTAPGGARMSQRATAAGFFGEGWEVR